MTEARKTLITGIICLVCFVSFIIFVINDSRHTKIEDVRKYYKGYVVVGNDLIKNYILVENPKSKFISKVYLDDCDKIIYKEKDTIK